MLRIARRAAVALLPTLPVLLSGCASSRQPDARNGARTSTSPEDARASLIAAERAFSAMAGERGTREAFIANLADDGLMFVPTAVPGREWLLADSTRFAGGLLQWEPLWAEVAASGDFGYTFGPYSLRRSAADTVVGRGTFVSVWKREAAGPWKVLLDLGNPANTGEVRRYDVARPASAPSRGASDAGAIIALRQTDIRTAGDAGAWLALVAPETRVFRPREPLRIGDDARPLAGRVAAERRTVTGAHVASSGDLAATYGTYETAADSSGPAGHGNYLRIWRRAADGRWRLALDEIVPVR